MEACLGSQADHFAGGVQSSSESHRLNRCSRGEVSTGDAIWESRVVLDPGARAGLATDSHRIEGDSSEALRMGEAAAS